MRLPIPQRPHSFKRSTKQRLTRSDFYSPEDWLSASPPNARIAHSGHSSPSRLRTCFQLCGRVIMQPHRVTDSAVGWSTTH